MVVGVEAFFEEVEDEVVDAQGFSDLVGGAGELGGGLAGEAGDVAGPVFAAGQEEGQDHDVGRAAFDALAVGRGDVGHGQFHVGRLDDVDRREFGGEAFGDFFEAVVGGGAAAAVVADDDAGGARVGGMVTHSFSLAQGFPNTFTYSPPFRNLKKKLKLFFFMK